MSDKEWEQFFDLLEQVINDTAGDWKERRQRLFDAAAEHGERSELNLEALGGWLNEE